MEQKSFIPDEAVSHLFVLPTDVILITYILKYSLTILLKTNSRIFSVLRAGSDQPFSLDPSEESHPHLESLLPLVSNQYLKHALDKACMKF